MHVLNEVDIKSFPEATQLVNLVFFKSSLDFVVVLVNFRGT
jgi:hypothetical protein